jgi:3-oxoacyl-[acyl-carrier-protein] synthase-3
MTSSVRVGIAGVGSQVPDRVLSNQDLEKLVDTSDEWIVQRTGIRERRVVSPGENCSDLATGAARKALAAAGLKATDLDMIIVGTVTADYLFPGVAHQVQANLGAPQASAFDVSAACSGFLAVLITGEAFVASGMATRVLVIGAEALTRIVNYEDRASCILFGDAAGAAVLTPFEHCDQGEILRRSLGADGTRLSMIWMPTGGSKHSPHGEDYDPTGHYITMQGREVYRFAVQKMAELIETSLEGTDPDEFGLVIPHQVNRRIIDGALDRLGLDCAKVVINIDRYGNTSAASVPLALDEALRDGRVEKGKLLVLVAFGAGLTWGSALVRW